MVSLFLTLPNDPSVTATCRSSNGKSMALSIADLTALRAQLKSQGRSLIHELRSRRVLDARTAADPIPTEQELFDPAVPVTVTVPPELAARRQYLQARSEEREYAQLVSSVQGHVVAEKNRESFAQFHQQASLGMNLILSIATATLCGYFIGRYSSPDKVNH